MNGLLFKIARIETKGSKGGGGGGGEGRRRGGGGGRRRGGDLGILNQEEKK